MKNKLQFILLVSFFLVIGKTSYGQNYTTEEVNKIMCRTWRFYSFDPDSTGKFFRFDYSYVLIADFVPGGVVKLHYTDTVLQGSWKWDEPNQLISISTSPNIDDKPSIFKAREMNKKKCVFEVPGATGKGSMLYLKEGAK